MINRRQFINTIGAATAGYGLSNLINYDVKAVSKEKFTFKISLAEFSFASELFTGKMTNMQFPERTKNEFGIEVLEYVSGFFNNKHTDLKYLQELKLRCDDLGMKNHLIMVDGANITALKSDERQKAVESHYPWLEAAKYLDCSAIRVNLGDAMAMISGKPEEGNKEEVAKAAVEGYSKLVEYANKMNMNVIVENHFSYSTDPDWLLGIMRQIPFENKGLLPDFGNFCAEMTKPTGSDMKSLMSMTCLKHHDRYQSVKKMMPYARGISAKTHKFNADGFDTETDFIKMFKIIKASGWTGGYVGIEYEGGLKRDLGNDTSLLSNKDGIIATKLLLEKVLKKLG